MTISKNKLTYTKRKDKNHAACVSTVRANGYYVVDTAVTGAGFPDFLVVSKVDFRIVVLFELKVDDEPLREREQEFFINYPGLAFVVRSAAHEGQEAGYKVVRIMEMIENDNNNRNCTQR